MSFAVVQFGYNHDRHICGLCFVAETALISKFAAAIVSEVVANA